ncbi:hypothetical protein BpHYR1_024883 [Brachionus plicatilis]|uniref:Uncharacterized protein n=1 Tax=Brachionus plicatilis TaxID=10195 RepID=A0A3M7PH50_BRAPC|nr:hypothetical protein BpHYR1_024883 [Brachionus plicatilis]
MKFFVINFVDDIIVVIFERLYSFLSANIRLGNNNFNIFFLNASSIDFLAIIFFFNDGFRFFVFCSRDRFSSLSNLSSLLEFQSFGSCHLSLLRQVFYLGFTENNIGIRSR